MSLALDQRIQEANEAQDKLLAEKMPAFMDSLSQRLGQDVSDCFDLRHCSVGISPFSDNQPVFHCELAGNTFLISKTFLEGSQITGNIRDDEDWFITFFTGAAHESVGTWWSDTESLLDAAVELLQYRQKMMMAHGLFIGPMTGMRSLVSVWPQDSEAGEAEEVLIQT